MNRETVLRYVFNGTRLVPESEQDMVSLALFQKGMEKGQVVEVFMNLASPVDKSLGQLARIHAMIREIANFTGQGFEDTKAEIKRKAGLFVPTGTRRGEMKLKSFAECSKEELSKAIESCIEVGDLVGYDLH